MLRATDQNNKRNITYTVGHLIVANQLVDVRLMSLGRNMPEGRR